MARKFQAIPSIFLVVAGVIGFSIVMAAFATAADVTTQSAQSEGDVGASTRDLVQGSHVEGHIAFLRAELGIAPEQESLWAPVAAAMREDVHKLQEAERKIGQKPAPDNAMEYLQNRVTFANLRAQGEVRFLTAFQPLYNILSPQQKQIADNLLIPNMSE